MIINSEWEDKDWDKLTVWLKEMLHVSPAKVTFTKKDGTERVMNCTLQTELLPVVELKEDAKPRKESTTSMRVFDLDLKEWRSFTIKNIKKIELQIGEKTED
jgi:hypothetical protein